MSSQYQERVERLAQEPFRLAAPPSGAFRGISRSYRDIWDHRELMRMLVQRELKARYKDSVLGFVWSMLRPLTMLLIYYVALGKFLGAARGIPDFAIFIYTGLTAWGLFSEAVSSGTGSILANSGLVKKVYLPREIFPLATLGSAMFNFAIQLVILLTATFVAGAVPTGGRWGYLPLSLAVIVVTALGWSLLLSAVNVYLRDVQYLVEIGLMVAFWASPIVYSWTLVEKAVHSDMLLNIYLSNPVTLAVLGFQKTFWLAGDGQSYPPDLYARMGIALAVGVVLLWLCQRTFARLQANFAQEL